jgi:hypothetical protein
MSWQNDATRAKGLSGSSGTAMASSSSAVRNASRNTRSMPPSRLDLFVGPIEELHIDGLDLNEHVPNPIAFSSDVVAPCLMIAPKCRGTAAFLKPGLRLQATRGSAEGAFRAESLGVADFCFPRDDERKAIRNAKRAFNSKTCCGRRDVSHCATDPAASIECNRSGFQNALSPLFAALRHVTPGRPKWRS